MKKEIIAGVVLIALLAAVLLNTLYISHLTDRLTNLVEEAEEAAKSEKWETSAAKTTEAIDLWNTSDKYTHIVLKHDEIGLISDSFYELLEEIHAGNAGTVRSAAHMVKTRLKNISKMETPAPGSIF